MFSLQRLLSKHDKFFDLLEASAEEAQHSVEALMELIEAPHDSRTLDEFILRRRQDKRITEELTELMCSAFVTPLEREDIQALASALYRIPKTVEKFAERLLVTQAHVQAGDFSRQAKLLEQSTDTVCLMVRQLRKGPSLDKAREENARLHQYEGEADKLMLELLRTLYGGQYEPVQMIVLRDLYELLEKVIDRCRDAGNVILEIVLKNS